MPNTKYKIHLLWVDKIVVVTIVGLLGLARPDYLMIMVYALLLPYLFFTHRKKALQHLLVASALAMGWMLFAKNEYAYNQDMVEVADINLFSLFAWASGLFGVYMIYSHWETSFHRLNAMKKFLLFAAFYIPILLTVETVAYYLFDIKNLAAAAYSGLPLCECVHAPRWMQGVYLGMGPFYFALCELIGLENPHARG